MDEKPTNLPQENVNVPADNATPVYDNSSQSISSHPSYSVSPGQLNITPDPDLVNLNPANTYTPPQPSPAPVAVPQPVAIATHTNPIDIVIQWLTYAFWGWTAIAILVITSMILSFYMQSVDIASMLPYSIAAVLVLLPISIVCEILYRKREPEKKTGASSVIMIIHAVLFALCGVGALVTIVLNLVQILISSSSSENTASQVFLYAAIVMVVVYAVLFFRTILPAKLYKLRTAVSGFMILISVTLIAIAALGPITNEMQTKNDKLIEGNISYVVDAIDKYFVGYNKMPNSLADISLTGDAARLQSENLVTYIDESGSGKTTYGQHKYQLCVNYVKADEIPYPNNQYDSLKELDSEYSSSSYISTYGHAAGKVCYKLLVGSSYTFDSSND